MPLETADKTQSQVGSLKNSTECHQLIAQTQRERKLSHAGTMELQTPPLSNTLNMHKLLPRPSDHVTPQCQSGAHLLEQPRIRGEWNPPQDRIESTNRNSSGSRRAQPCNLTHHTGWTLAAKGKALWLPPHCQSVLWDRSPGAGSVLREDSSSLSVCQKQHLAPWVRTTPHSESTWGWDLLPSSLPLS